MLDNTAAMTHPAIPCRPVRLAKLDQRTKKARLMRETRAALIAHVGGKPSAVQSALIEQACQLTLRIATMDRKFAETGEQTDHDSRTYLAWSNTLTRTLRQLGMRGTAERGPTLAELLAQPPARPPATETPAGPQTPPAASTAPAAAR